jgi:hypothetical protein
MKIIDSFRLVVLKIQWLKPIALVFVVASLGLFGYIIFGSSGIAKDDYYLIPSVLVLGWSMSLCSILYTFPFVPESPGKDAGFFKRMVIRIKRFYYFLLAMVAVGITGALLIFSIRALRVWLNDYS